MKNNEIIKAFDILEKMEFFGGQRAGRELWLHKPIDIQNKDIEDFLRDIDFLKTFINNQQAEIERQRELPETADKAMKIAEMAVKCCTRNPKAHTAEECFNCEFKNGMCDSYRLAKILYEEGYEKTDVLKKQIADLRNRLHLIWAIGCDYDGCNTVESLKELIDELVSYTQLPAEEIPDITSRTGRWILESDEEEPNLMFKLVKCSACGKKIDLPNYEKANYCFNCGAKNKMEVAE